MGSGGRGGRRFGVQGGLYGALSSALHLALSLPISLDGDAIPESWLRAIAEWQGFMFGSAYLYTLPIEVFVSLSLAQALEPSASMGSYRGARKCLSQLVKVNPPPFEIVCMCVPLR